MVWHNSSFQRGAFAAAELECQRVAGSGVDDLCAAASGIRSQCPTYTCCMSLLYELKQHTENPRVGGSNPPLGPTNVVRHQQLRGNHPMGELPLKIRLYRAFRI